MLEVAIDKIMALIYGDKDNRNNTNKAISKTALIITNDNDHNDNDDKHKDNNNGNIAI